MEEGQTVEIQETREPLREQGSIRALLELLEQQGMERKKWMYFVWQIILIPWKCSWELS